MAEHRDFICIGHRGAMGYRPENTLPAFDLALSMGCPWIELDVHVCQGELVVIHDRDLERTTNGTGQVDEVSFEYLRSLDAGGGAQVPTLTEVIDLIVGHARINIELKGTDTALPVSHLLNQYCERGYKPEDFMLSSFDHTELRLADLSFRRGALFGRRRDGEDRVQIAVDLDAWSLNPLLSSVSKQEIDDAHQAGLRVLVYTVNSAEDITRMRDLGVDGIFTNFPDRALALR